MLSPPDGSKIEIDFEDGYQRIIIPQKSDAVRRFFSCFFLLFSLGILIVFLVLFFRHLNGLSVFVVFLLCPWILGVTMRLWTAYRVLRPAVPEILLLTKYEMLYDSGVAPLQYPFQTRSRTDYWEKLFQRRIKASFSPAKIKTLALRHFETTHRLTIDDGSTRIDLAAGASEPEREWLFDVLCQYYGVAREIKTCESETRTRPTVDKLAQRATRKRAKRGIKQCPHCLASTHIEAEGANDWEVCDACGWSGLVKGQESSFH